VIQRCVAWSASHSWVVILVAFVLAAAGEVARRTVHHDAIPDLSSPQIVLVVDWMGHPATEVAERVTRPLTAAVEGIPGAAAVRGSSMSGMAYVDVIFDSDGADLRAAREVLAGRVDRVRADLPSEARVQVGPVAAATGWVFQYVLIDPQRRQSGLALRRLQDESLRPALASLPGVAEVASVGGAIQEVLVELEAERLERRAVAFSDVATAVRTRLARDPTPTLADLEALPVATGLRPDGSADPVRLADVGRVHLADDMPTGLADFRGIEPAVGGTVIAGRDADVPRVIHEVARVLDAKRKELPPGVEIVTAYDRSDLIDRVGATLARAIVEEVAVVVIVTLLFLLDARSALVPLLTLPVVLLFAFGAMWILHVPATIMSMGGLGIALGMAVDADIVALEACHRRVERAQGSSSGGYGRRKHLVAAAGSFAPAILVSLVIAALGFLPVFAFTGESGRLLRPLALTKTLVIAAAALVTMTLAPALRDRLLRSRVIPELANPLTSGLVRAYKPFVHFALCRPMLTLGTAALALLSCVPIAARLGGEFLPRIDEGDLLFMPSTLPGVTGDLAENQLLQQDRALRGFSEVSSVFGKVGRADTATDPAPYAMAETVVRLKPRSEWPSPREPQAELVARLDKATRMPGWTSAWTAPARARMDMMATGVRTPVAVRIVAPSSARLDALGAAVRDVLANLTGTRSAAYESLGGETWLDVAFDPDALRDRGVDPGLARSTADLLVTGGQLGDVTLDGRRMRVRITPDANMPGAMPGPMAAAGLRGPADQLRAATVRAADGTPVPLGLLGRSQYELRPAMLRTEQGALDAYVYVDLAEGTDLLDYVRRGREALAAAQASAAIRLEPGERLEWAGQYGLLAAGARHFGWIAPGVLALMFALLWLQFRSVTEAFLVLSSVPFALVGSIWTLYVLGYAMSAPVWVGLLSTVGLAMQTGVVMVIYIDEAFYRRVRAGLLRTRADIVAAHAEGTVARLRPKLMTVTIMAASLLPLLWAEGAGAEVMKRVAAPMVGGLATSAMLTLEVLPVIYTLWRSHQLQRAERLGVPLEAIVGAPPPWARGEL
jgi:Cu(I)/Ag(I) efflux system membrane protein CusA/SilA